MADSTMTDNEVAEAARKKEYVKMKETEDRWNEWQDAHLCDGNNEQEQIGVQAQQKKEQQIGKRKKKKSFNMQIDIILY